MVVWNHRAHQRDQNQSSADTCRTARVAQRSTRVNNEKQRQKLHAELVRMRAESQRLIREHRKLVAKFVHIHGRLDELHKRGNTSTKQSGFLTVVCWFLRRSNFSPSSRSISRTRFISISGFCSTAACRAQLLPEFEFLRHSIGLLRGGTIGTISSPARYYRLVPDNRTRQLAPCVRWSRSISSWDDDTGMRGGACIAEGADASSIHESRSRTRRKRCLSPRRARNRDEFVRVAETATDPDKIKRNFSNAKKAYLTVCRFINQSDSGPESAKLHKKLKQLERRLQALESRVATSWALHRSAPSSVGTNKGLNSCCHGVSCAHGTTSRPFVQKRLARVPLQRFTYRQKGGPLAVLTFLLARTGKI